MLIHINKKYVSLISIIIVGVIIFAVVRWNDYREKDLVEVLDAEQIVEIHYTDRDKENLDVPFNSQLNDQESIDELIGFLSQYRVKKEGGRDFETEYPEEQFSFEVFYDDERITISSLIERDVLLFEMDQYNIVNGPVDYARLLEFMDRQN